MNSSLIFFDIFLIFFLFFFIFYFFFAVYGSQNNLGRFQGYIVKLTSAMFGSLHDRRVVVLAYGLRYLHYLNPTTCPAKFKRREDIKHQIREKVKIRSFSPAFKRLSRALSSLIRTTHSFLFPLTLCLSLWANLDFCLIYIYTLWLISLILPIDFTS